MSASSLFLSSLLSLTVILKHPVVERIVDSVEKKKKMKKVLEEVKLEEEKKMVKEDARLGLGPMTDGPVDVQLRWANLRTRKHHVRGPKKSPRKMVLRRLILRKAEEAKRTTTWAPYRVQCPCLQCQNQPCWILLNFPSVDMGTLSKTVRFSLYPSHWVHGDGESPD